MSGLDVPKSQVVPQGSFKVVTRKELTESISRKGSVQYATVNKEKGPHQYASANKGDKQTVNTENIPRVKSVKYEKQETTGYPEQDVGEYVELRRKTTGVLTRNSSKDTDAVDFNIFLSEVDNGMRGIVELSTLHHDVIDKVKLRVICLFDVSGSMLLKCGRSRQHSKLTKLKKMAEDLVDGLENHDDFVGLVTFGEKSRIVCPLTKVNDKSRGEVKSAIATVDKEISSKTDLVSGALQAIELLKQGPEAKDVTYRNAIIAFSDGEINKGVTDPDKVVHAIREKIRASRPSYSFNVDQWLSIACVTTGGNVSDAMYLLSKHCGNDAYYYVDSQLDHPEVDMMIPLLLRKSAIAQFLTVTIKSTNGAELVPDKCSREHTIKRRRREQENKDMTYFLHDLPAGSQKHFSVAIDLNKCTRKEDSDIMYVTLEYVDALGRTQEITKSIRFADGLTPLKDPEKFEQGVLLLAKQDMRDVMQVACRKTADLVAIKNSSNHTGPLEEGKTHLHDLMESYGRLAKREETKTKIAEFAAALIGNIDKLIESLEKSVRGEGHKWTKIKAVSSAVARETPNVAGMVSKSETVCPLPAVRDCATTRTKALAMKLYRKQDVSSVIFDGYHQDLFGAAKILMQSLGNIVNVLEQVEGKPKDSTLVRGLVASMVFDDDDSHSDEDEG